MKRTLLIIASLFIIAGCDKEDSRNSGGNNNGGGTLSSCSGGQTTVTDIDGNVYNVVSIGNQCWMKENLRTTKYRNGDSIATNLGPYPAWESTTSGAWSYYDNNPQYNIPFGKLYNWYTVADPRGVCPTGWHVPTREDINNLILFVDPQADTSYQHALLPDSYPSYIAGDAMKSTGTLQGGDGLWDDSLNSSNSSNFSLVPNGYRGGSVDFGNMYCDALLWLSDDFGLVGMYPRAWKYEVACGGTMIGVHPSPKHWGKAIRCVKD